MNPMRLIIYTLFIGVATLVAMGGLGFYLGYSAGRGDLSEMKEFVLKSISPENATAINEALKAQGGKAVAQEVNLSPVLEEIRSISAQISRIEQASPGNGASPQVIEKIKEDPKLREELASATQKLARTTEQYNTCTRELGVMKVKIEAQTATQPQQPQQSPQTQQPRVANNQPQHGGDSSVVLYDNVLLKREGQKVYNEVDMSLALQSVASRSARVVVNQQSLSISFGERKIIQHRDARCSIPPYPA